jgi:phage terminase small subunit
MATTPAGHATLTPKQERFCQEYLLDLNATQAAIRAGYSAKTANEQGARLLAKASVAARVSEMQTERAKRIEVTQDYVLRRLVDNVERAMQAEPVRDREGNETGEYVYQGAVANGSLKMLGEHLGMFRQRVEHSGPDGGPIPVDGLTPDQMAATVAQLLATAQQRKDAQP